MAPTKLFVSLMVFSFVNLVMLGILYKLSRTVQNRGTIQTSSRKRLLILNWDKGRSSSEHGMEGGCEMTTNRSRLLEADAVIFSHRSISHKDMPWKYERKSSQVYIWSTREAPGIIQRPSVPNAYREFDGGFFNWTYTLRHDSDVINIKFYRGDVLKTVSKGKKAVDDVIAKKKKLAIWIVSSCAGIKGNIRRLEVAMELEKAGLDLEKFGDCFDADRALAKDANLYDVISEYKFYLSFENSLHCKDYITEKFWRNGLLSDAVPLVWGPSKDDLLSIAPLDSFVFVEDFASSVDVVKYLKYLDSHDEEYRKLFRWREDATMTDEKMIEMTKSRYPHLTVFKKQNTNVCERLLDRKEPKVYESFTDWFINDNPLECVGRQ